MGTRHHQLIVSCLRALKNPFQSLMDNGQYQRDTEASCRIDNAALLAPVANPRLHAYLYPVVEPPRTIIHPACRCEGLAWTAGPHHIYHSGAAKMLRSENR